MGFARLAAIGMIALTMTTQTGWGQDAVQREQELRRARQQAVQTAALAQDQAAQTQTAPQDVRQLISVSFPGGTIGEYVAALRKASPAANIVVSPEAANMPAPEVILRDVTLGVAAAAVEFQRETAGEVNEWEAVEVQPLHRGGGYDSSAFRITYRRSVRNLPNTAKQDASAWSVADLLSNGYESDQVLAAIQVGQALFGESATIKYHEPTKLLVARGTSEQLSLISRTLDQLRSGRPGDDRQVEVRNEIARHQQWLERINAQLEPVQTRIVEIRRDLERDNERRGLPAGERGKLESDLRALEKQREDLLTNRRNAETSIRMAEERLRSLREQK